MAQKGRNRGVDRERDAFGRRQLAELRRPVLVHPEAACEIDLAGRIAAFCEQPDGCRRTLPGRDPRRPNADRRHAWRLEARPTLERPGRTPSDALTTFSAWESDPPASSSSSWTSTFASPTSG